MNPSGASFILYMYIYLLAHVALLKGLPLDHQYLDHVTANQCSPLLTGLLKTAHFDESISLIPSECILLIICLLPKYYPQFLGAAGCERFLVSNWMALCQLLTCSSNQITHVLGFLDTLFDGIPMQSVSFGGVSETEEDNEPLDLALSNLIPSLISCMSCSTSDAARAKGLLLFNKVVNTFTHESVARLILELWAHNMPAVKVLGVTTLKTQVALALQTTTTTTNPRSLFASIFVSEILLAPLRDLNGPLYSILIPGEAIFVLHSVIMHIGNFMYFLLIRDAENITGVRASNQILGWEKWCGEIQHMISTARRELDVEMVDVVIAAAAETDGAKSCSGQCGGNACHQLDSGGRGIGGVGVGCEVRGEIGARRKHEVLIRLSQIDLVENVVNNVQTALGLNSSDPA